MATLKASLTNVYVKAETQNTVYVYSITGDSQAFVDSQTRDGQEIRVDKDGNPLFFHTVRPGESHVSCKGIELPFVLSQKGNWYVDNTPIKQALNMAQASGVDVTQLIFKLAGLSK